MSQKKFLFVNRKAPYGTVYALESLEVVLISAAFEQDVSVAFLDDGVYQLLKAQNGKALGMKNFSATFRALGDYGVTRLYVERDALSVRGLTAADLMDITYDDDTDQVQSAVILVDQAQMAAIMADHDVILSF